MRTLIEQLDVTQLATRFVEFLPRFVAGLVLLLLFYLVYRATRPPLRAVLVRSGLHPTLVTILADNVYRMTMLVFGVVMAADQIGINIGAALAGIGVVGLAVGFAAQDSLANIIAGFLIFIDKPFQVGDWISVVEQYGEVNTITMRSTRIRTKRNTYVVIPNKTIIDAVLVNHSQHGSTRVDVPIGIAYKEHIPKARAVLLPAVRDLPGVVADPPPDLVVTGLGASSVDMDLRVWIDAATDEQPVFFRVMEASKLALDAAGIEIPYPHLQLFVENVEDRVWTRLAETRAGDTGSANVTKD